MAAAVDRHKKSNGQGQGMNWIRKEKRLALYMRDGLACAYCGQAVEDGAQLTLDHLTPYVQGGSHDATNLITCCQLCNSARGSRSVDLFAAAVAEYKNHGLDAGMILAHIAECTHRPVDVAAAKNIMAKRANWAACLKK